MSVQFLNIKDVLKLTTLSRSTIYSMINRGEFPKPIKLAQRRATWMQSDIDTWIEGRIKLRDS